MFFLASLTASYPFHAALGLASAPRGAPKILGGSLLYIYSDFIGLLSFVAVYLFLPIQKSAAGCSTDIIRPSMPPSSAAFHVAFVSACLLALSLLPETYL
jgi:hypothetical protein